MPPLNKAPQLVILTQDQVGAFRNQVMQLADGLLAGAIHIQPPVSQKVGRRPGRPRKDAQQPQG